MSEKDTKQFQKTYAAAGILCLCFLASSLVFVFHMMLQNERENIRYVYDMANQNSAMLEKQIKSDFETLRGVAVCIGEGMHGTEDDGLLLSLLDKINNHNMFIRMGLADLRGEVDLVDIAGHVHDSVDVSRRDFFMEAVQGRESISGVFTDSLDRETGHGENDIYYYGEPVVEDGRVISVLCAVNRADVLREIVDASVLNGRGYSNIVDSEGEIVIRSAHPDAVGDGAVNLSEMGDFSEKQIFGILEKMDSGEQGEVVYRRGNAEQIGVFVPVGVHDWYVFSSVPQSALRQRYSQTAAGVVLIIVTACVIFLFLLRRQSKLMENSKEALMRLAYNDALTGCRNQPKFLIDAEQRWGRDDTVHYAMWYCDLKKFKYYNDIFGYEAGDRVLKYVAGILADSVGEDGLFCRVSADNFAGMITYHRKEELTEWFASLKDCMMREKLTTANRLHAELSMGFYCPDQTDGPLSITGMINRANMAQKMAKAESGSQCAFYNKEIREQILRDSGIEARGRTALENGEFIIYFQPKVYIQNGNRLAGAEALTRWNSPDRGLIPPGEFIPVFERSGFIVELDRHIFERVCRWFSGRLGQCGQSINIAVNVSRLGMLQEDFVEHYSSVKEKYGIPDGLLELEFTESMIVDDEMFKETVRRIREKGFVCSMDDFGSGFSSLNLLKNLPIDVLKLDILFFREGTDIRRERIVISNVISMARQLEIKTIAEGVETQEQVGFLRAAGCDIVQGYVFSRPVPVETFEGILSDADGKEFKVMQ